ncbi:hypothetical protein BU17DRAFT_92960 [Hysterangium stoloniferum]|nr:hypothetical protein BU17DRAFT_92960 [Hysterangium stoloniferum]
MLRDGRGDEFVTVLLPGQVPGARVGMMGRSREGTVERSSSVGVETRREGTVELGMMSRAGTEEPVSVSASVSRAGTEGIMTRGNSEEREVVEPEIVDLTGDDDDDSDCGDEIVEIEQPIREPSIFDLPDGDAHSSTPSTTTQCPFRPFEPSIHVFPAPYTPIKGLFNPFAVPNDAHLWIRRQSARRERRAEHTAPTPTIDDLMGGFNAMDVDIPVANAEAGSTSKSASDPAPAPRPQKPLPRRFNGSAQKPHAGPNRPSARTFSNSSSSTTSQSSGADSGLSRCSSYSTIASSVLATPEAVECELPREREVDSEGETETRESDSEVEVMERSSLERGDDDAGTSGREDATTAAGRSKTEAGPCMDEIGENKWEELLAAVSVVSPGVYGGYTNCPRLPGGVNSPLFASGSSSDYFERLPLFPSPLISSQLPSLTKSSINSSATWYVLSKLTDELSRLPPLSQQSIKPSLQPHRHPSAPRYESVSPVINPHITKSSESHDLCSDTPAQTQTHLDPGPKQKPKAQKHSAPAPPHRKPAPPHRKPAPPSHCYTKPLSRVARACYPFFLAHLHNPYPTPQEKEAIVKDAAAPAAAAAPPHSAPAANCPGGGGGADPREDACAGEVTLTSVSNWFANSRRRCGWVEICAENFGGDVARMVAVCGRLFVSGGGVDVGEGVVEKLEAMRARVKAWHEEQVKPSDWAVALYNLLMKFSEKETRGIKQPKHICTVSTSTTKPSDQESSIFVAEGQSPSPGNSMVSELDSLCISEELDVNVPEPEIVAGRKRAHDPQEEWPLAASLRCVSSTSSVFSSTSDLSVPSLTYSSDDEFRPSKRLRSETASPTSSWSDQDPNFSIDVFDYPFDFMCDVPATEPSSTSARVSGEGLKRNISQILSSDIDEVDSMRSVKRARLTDPPHQPQSIGTINLTGPTAVAPGVVDSLAAFAGTDTTIESLDDIFSTTYNWDLFSMPATTQVELELANISPPDPAMPLDVTLYDWGTFTTPDAVSAETELLELLRTLTESPTVNSLLNTEHQLDAPVASVNDEPPDPQHWQDKLVSGSGLSDGRTTLTPTTTTTCAASLVLPTDSLSVESSSITLNSSLDNGQVVTGSLHPTSTPETLVHSGTTLPGALSEENLPNQVDPSFENWFMFSDLV